MWQPPISPFHTSHLATARHLSFAFSEHQFITSPNPLDTPYDLFVLLNDSHSRLANTLSHIINKTIMTALVARNSSLNIIAPTSITSSCVLQSSRPEHRRKKNLRLSRSKHQPQSHTPLSPLMQRQTLRTLKPVCKSSQN